MAEDNNVTLALPEALEDNSSGAIDGKGSIDAPTVQQQDVPLEGGTDSSPVSPPIAEPSLEDKAAHDYRMLIPKFFEIADHLPKKQLVRTIKAIMEYPLEEDKPKLAYEAEKKAFYLGMCIFDAKFVLMAAVREIMNDKVKRAQLEKDLAELKQKETTDNAVSG